MNNYSIFPDTGQYYNRNHFELLLTPAITLKCIRYCMHIDEIGFIRPLPDLRYEYFGHQIQARFYPGSPGSGAGKGGGAGGSIRESGGALGRWGAANEEGYFYKKQQEQLEKMKQKIDKEGPKDVKKQDDPV